MYTSHSSFFVVGLVVVNLVGILCASEEVCVCAIAVLVLLAAAVVAILVVGGGRSRSVGPARRCVVGSLQALM